MEAQMNTDNMIQAKQIYDEWTKKVTSQAMDIERFGRFREDNVTTQETAKGQHDSLDHRFCSCGAGSTKERIKHFYGINKPESES